MNAVSVSTPPASTAGRICPVLAMLKSVVKLKGGCFQKPAHIHTFTLITIFITGLSFAQFQHPVHTSYFQAVFQSISSPDLPGCSSARLRTQKHASF